MPISGYFNSQVERLRASLVKMGELASRQIADSIASYVANDPILAQEVIQRDVELDRLEDWHEEHIIQMIALNQPVARDLRLLVAFLRVNSTIERAADLAVNTAQACIRLHDKPVIRPYVDIPRAYDLVRLMWTDAIRAFANLDEAVATELRDRDDAIDRLNQEIIIQLIEISRDTPELVYQATNVIGVSKNLERIGDLAVDISDEVIFVSRGELRHARTNKKTA